MPESDAMSDAPPVVCGYKTTLSRDDYGHEVWALQICLNCWLHSQEDEEELVPLYEDGAYGGRTYRRVRTYQRRRDLYLDGIAGPVTQRHLALDLMRPPSEAHGLPAGLLRGQCELESAYIVGAVNCRVAGAKDCFWTQRRIKDGSPENIYYEAANGSMAFDRSAQELRRRKDRFYDAAPTAIKDHEFMWKAAVLAHNWPAAAEKMAAGGFDGWHYTSGGEQYGVDDPAPWVKAIGVPGVETGRQWANFYIGKVTVYVDWSNV